MIIDRKMPFLVKMARNIAALPEDQRGPAISQMHPDVRPLLEVTVKAMLSRVS